MAREQDDTKARSINAAGKAGLVPARFRPVVWLSLIAILLVGGCAATDAPPYTISWPQGWKVDMGNVDGAFETMSYNRAIDPEVSNPWGTRVVCSSKNDEAYIKLICLPKSDKTRPIVSDAVLAKAKSPFERPEYIVTTTPWQETTLGSLPARQTEVIAQRINGKAYHELLVLTAANNRTCLLTYCGDSASFDRLRNEFDAARSSLVLQDTPVASSAVASSTAATNSDATDNGPGYKLGRMFGGVLGIIVVGGFVLCVVGGLLYFLVRSTYTR